MTLMTGSPSSLGTHTTMRRSCGGVPSRWGDALALYLGAQKE